MYLQSSHDFLRMEMELERAGIHLYHNYPRGRLIYVVNINNETVVKFKIHTFFFGVVMISSCLPSYSAKTVSEWISQDKRNSRMRQ